MRIGLAWIDPKDPTDRVVSSNLSRALRARGHRVFIVGPRRFRSSSALLRFHKEKKIDLWHCHAFGRKHTVFAEASRRAAWPLVLTPHLVLEDYGAFAAGLASLVRSASRITTVSKANLKELVLRFPETKKKSLTVYSYGPSAIRAQSRPGDYALCVSRLAPYKGVDILLMAFSATKGFNLVVCGRDKSRGGMARLASRLGVTVRFTGEVSRARVAALMAGSRFIVQPSRRDNFPIALLEAMAYGKPVIATRVGGIPEMVQEILIPPNNPPVLARAMSRLHADASLRRKLGAAARKRAKLFTWERAAADYEKVYASL